jgi:hypothetical protein
MTSVTLQWTAPTSDGESPITDYKVLMDEGDGDGFVSLGLTGSGSTLEYVISDLVPGEDYYFLAVAINIVGQGPDSTATKIVAGLEPSQPAQPVLTGRTESSIAFSFTAPTNLGESPIIGYKILWNGGSGSVFSSLTTISDLSSLTFAKSNNILGGVTYGFQVVAVNVVGDSVASLTLSILAA